MNLRSNSSKFVINSRRGMVLVETLAVVVTLAAMAVVFARSMRLEATASDNRYAEAQARAIAQGAADYVVQTQDIVESHTVQVGDGAYWLLRPQFDLDFAEAYGWGLIDEGAKLNLNTADASQLARLPGMTDQIAAAIVDWRDSDSETGENGAEDDYYLMLSPSYQAKNAPFETVEELLLIRDVTPELLFGEDINRNGVLDPNEDDGDANYPLDNADGRLDYGIIEYVTVVSQPREQDDAAINVNGEQGMNNNEERQAIADALRYQLGDARASELAGRIVDQRPHQNMIDLFYKAGLTIDEYERGRFDALFTTTDQSGPLVNINTAPRAVLLTFPQLTEADVDGLINYREARGATVPGGTVAFGEDRSISAELEQLAWVTQVLDREKAIAIGGLITTASTEYTADVVASAKGGRGFDRIHVTFTTSGERPRALAWRRMTHLGWPLGAQLMADLRAGIELHEIAQAQSGGIR